MIAILLLGGLALRLLYLATPRLDSDQAVFGLMARHALHGEFSTFQWGYDYMGTLESLTAAPLMLVFGENRFALNLAPALYSLLFALAAYLATREAAGRRAGLWALAFGCFPPTYLLWTCVRARGAYSETLALGTLAFFFALRALAPLDEREESRCLAAVGLVLGLSFWTHLLTVLWAVPVLILWLWERPALLRRGIVRAGIPFLLGSAPLWIACLHSGFAPFAVEPPHDRPLAAKLAALLVMRLPVLLGMTLSGEAAPRIPLHAWPLAALQLASVALLGRLAAGRAGEAPALRRFARLLVVFTVFSLAVYLGTAFSVAATERYLIPLYTVLVPAPAILVGSLHRRGAAAIGLAAVALQAGPAVRAATLLDPEALRAYRAEDRADAKLFAALDGLGIDRVYAESYWDGPRLTFESAERIVFANPFHDRHPPYLDAVDAADRVAFLFRDRPLDFEGTLALASARFSVDVVHEPPAADYWIYHSIEAAPGDGPELAVAAAAASESGDAPDLGFDLDAGSRWVTRRPPQVGMWYEVDLGSPRTVAEVAYWPRVASEAPAGVRVEVSSDHERWSEVTKTDRYWGPIDWVRGRPVPSLEGWVDARFAPVECRWIRIVLARATRAARWGVAEIKVRGPRTRPQERPPAELPAVRGRLFADAVLAARSPSGVRRWQGQPIPGVEDLRDAFLIGAGDAVLLPKAELSALEALALRFGLRVGGEADEGDYALVTRIESQDAPVATAIRQAPASLVEDVAGAVLRLEANDPGDIEGIAVRAPSAEKLAWQLTARTSIDGRSWSAAELSDLTPHRLCWTAQGVLAAPVGERLFRLRTPQRARFIELSPVIPKVRLPWRAADFALLRTRP